MSLFLGICKLFWNKVEKSDIKNIASQSEPEGLKKYATFPILTTATRCICWMFITPKMPKGNCR